MSGIKQKLMRFMYGRYGMDKLYYFLIVFSLVLSLIGSFSRIPYFSFVSYALIFYAFYRFFSKQIHKRRAENAKFLKVWNKVKSFFVLWKHRFRDIRSKRYRSCPNCKHVIRFPLKRGKHQAACPRCKKDFSVRIVF